LSQAWQQLKWHSMIRSRPILASTERQMYLMCWDIFAHWQPIGRHRTSWFYWEQTHHSTRKICCKWWMKWIDKRNSLSSLRNWVEVGNWKVVRRWEVDQFLLWLKRINNQNQLEIGTGHINQLKDGLSYVETLMLMCQHFKGVACLVWVSWCLHLRYGFQCYRSKTVLIWWSYGPKCWQCNGMAWNFWCWRCLDFYRKRLNPTWQSTKRADSRERYAGRWETSLACRAQVGMVQAWVAHIVTPLKCRN
jgi:hypothetical protein